ncbi:MAG: hypothetical protein GAK38_03007 [Xylophilus sp.]|nr:MAG: hypothetical protein GAK38_03007 [Xylophilus sp.]
MELFFLISGFFSALIMERKGTEYFLENRRRRLFEPLLWGILLVNVPLYFFVKTVDPNAPASAYLVLHLWFLQSLLVISIVYVFYMPFFRRLERWSAGQLIVLALVLGIGSKAVSALGKIPDLAFLSGLAASVMHHIIFFAVGHLLYAKKIGLPRNSKKWLLLTTLVCTPLLLAYQYLVYKYQGVLGDLPFVYKAARHTSEQIVFLANAICISLLLFDTAKSMNDSRIEKLGGSVDFVIRSALVTYILHYPIIGLANHMLYDQQWESWQYFLIIATAGLVVPIMIYTAFKRFRLFRHMFGIKDSPESGTSARDADLSLPCAR